MVKDARLGEEIPRVVVVASHGGCTTVGGGAGIPRGGEEMRGLGAGVERIERLTEKKKGGGKVGSLEKSRKRPTEDGPRGSGSAAGDAFEKRRKIVGRYRK